MAGYSGTPLVQKIGIKPGHRIILRNHPPSFLKDLGPMPDGAEHTEELTGKANVIVCFTDRKAELQKKFRQLAGKLVPDGMLWISWPKKASGMPTDLTEDVVREVGLDCGLVDVKVCAIDNTWSGLKFVIRTKDRPRAGKKPSR
ncbi:MAG TPA: DUF3052 domain-containing protein [Verrucomicrobiae bacterium]|nr:DUF3052 domain-containing protein [Verrucomicrobiae bacterium]